ncbi:MAG: hypothetical protein R2710_14195 [Acidimicrobiales bacterium]
MLRTTGRSGASGAEADGGVTTYPVVDRAEDLAYLANQGTLTFHMWASSVSAPDHRTG